MIPAATIVLSTFNGAHFLHAQLESIAKQSFADWRILARDDGSSDESVEILDAFARRFPGRVERLDDERGTLGAPASFGVLLEAVRTPYALLCDQDDVWLPNKIEVELAAMCEAEARLGRSAPILVYGDLVVVDDALRTLAPSFWEFQKLDPKMSMYLNRLLVQNVVTGCAVMVNRALLERALPIPSGAVMHDWWLALVARLFGEVVTMRQPLLLYRQHGDNVVGARGAGFGILVRKLNDLQGVSSRLTATMKQAEELLNRYRTMLAHEQMRVLECYASLPWCAPWARVMTVFRHRLFKSGVLRNAGLVLTLLWMKRVTFPQQEGR